MADKKSILIADDHQIVRQGLAMLIASESEYEILGEADNGVEAIRAVSKLEPDIILMDLSMPKMNGLEAAREIKALQPQTKILVLTVHDSEEHIFEAFQAGVDGYVLKSAAKDELLLAIQRVLLGECFISPKIGHKLVDGFVERALSIKESTSWDLLTARERQILKLIGEGYTNKKIADILFISPKTVETHRSNLMKKLDLHNAQELTVYAAKKGLLP